MIEAMSCGYDTQIDNLQVTCSCSTKFLLLSLKEMGDNLTEVDLGTNFDAVDMSLGDKTSCFVSKGGDLKCFGRNDYGQLGQGDFENRGDEPGVCVTYSFLVNSAQIWLLLLQEMGDNLTAIDLGTDFKVMEVATRSAHVCAGNANSKWKCWGYVA